MKWLLPAALIAATLLAGVPAHAMPYVPQTVGTYDTTYQKLKAAHCRGCHGANTSDLHKASLTLGCSDCHYPDPNDVERDCLVCHTQEEARYGSGTIERGHHVAYYAEVGECSNCHNLVPVADYGSVPPPQGPLDSTAPCPENCRTCHKRTGKLQPPLVALDGAGPENLHHSPQGKVVTDLKCDYCHDTSLPHYDQRQIRVCANCHPHELLHDLHYTDLGLACVGCHKPLTTLIYITDAYTTNAGGERQSEFAPGETVQYHIAYDLVGNPNTQYVVKAVIRFGKKRRYRQRERHYPGQDQHIVLERTIPDLQPGRKKRLVYKLLLRKDGVLLSKDRVIVPRAITIVSP